jgi:hypothetical protein
LRALLQDAEAVGAVASIVDPVNLALVPHRAGSHWYALRVRNDVFDRFLLAVSIRMTALQPCRIEDVASGAFGTIEACRNPGAPTAVSLFLADVQQSLDAQALLPQRAPGRIWHALLQVHAFLTRNGPNLTIDFVQRPNIEADARFEKKNTLFSF